MKNADFTDERAIAVETTREEQSLSLAEAGFRRSACQSRVLGI
jgi:hypothetical protein